MIEKEFSTVVWEVAPKATTMNLQYDKPVGPEAPVPSSFKSSIPEASPSRKLRSHGFDSVLYPQIHDTPRVVEYKSRLLEVFTAVYSETETQPTEDEIMYLTWLYLSVAYPGDQELKALVRETFPLLFEEIW
jgi:hypothetical protein